MKWIELELTAEHYRDGVRRMSGSVLPRARRGGWAAQGATFVAFGLLGALVVAGLRSTTQLSAGADRWTAEHALRTTLFTFAIIGTLGLLWFGFREWQVRRDFRRMEEQADAHFRAPLPVRIAWGAGELRWDSEEGVGGMPLSTLHAWDAGRDLILLYLAPFHFLPVPRSQLEPAEIESLIEALQEAGVSKEWKAPGA